VGSFPAYGRWSEWNGRFRDALRKYLKGDPGAVGEMASRIQGSHDLYARRGATASINFVTCHDGFTLMDLVSYNGKHNESNGEDNRDGANDNESWNCGWEGPTDDPEINRLRRRQIKNAITLLMVSRGVPMILMGDEMGRTQQGNNNTYCHDNELNWLDWSSRETNGELFRFFQAMIAFRRAHPVLRSARHYRHQAMGDCPYADITFHGVKAWHADWENLGHCLAFMLCGCPDREGAKDNPIYVAMNTFWETQTFEPPAPPPGYRWHMAVNTGMEPPDDIWQPGAEPALSDSGMILVGSRSVVVLVGKEISE
ncbi:MAG TPA: glycogen debranching enzyme, partial [bacterium]|nr:glycogen debranching enzyme [bacterium]